MKKLLRTMLVFAAISFFVATSYAETSITDDPLPNLNFPSDNTWETHTFNISGSYDPSSQKITSAVPKVYVYDDNDDQADELSELTIVTVDGVNKGIRGVENTNDLSNDANKPSSLDPNEGVYEINSKPRLLEKDPVNDKAEPNVETQNNSQVPVPSIVWLIGLGLIGLLTLRRRRIESQPNSTIRRYLR